MSFRTDDPVADFLRHDARQAKRLSERPVCTDCHDPIQEETAYYINGEWICESCMEDYRREVFVG